MPSLLPTPMVVAWVGCSTAFICPFVCFSTWYLKNWCSYNRQTWHRHGPSWVLGVKRSEACKTLPAWVMALLSVLASF